MREMVLNHASVMADNRYVANEWLIGFSKGIRAIRDNGVVKSSMRAKKYFHEIRPIADVSLYDLTIALLSTSAKGEAKFLMELDSRSIPLPVDDPTPDSVTGKSQSRWIAPIGQPLSRADAAPLLYCAITDGIAVGFPSDAKWEHDRIYVVFNEISPDGDEIGEATETIDNLTRSEHADSIIERHQAHQRIGIPNFNEFWACREAAFPNIIFGPDVENHLNEVEIGHLSAIVKKVTMIDGCAATWRTTKSAMPDWGGKVTPESPRVRNNRALIEARRFSSRKGATEIFEWHARFGGGRIHLRFDAQTKEVEIGYIGKHLPL